MSEALFIKTPFPPTVNTYWRNIVMQGKPRTITSKEGRVFRERVLSMVCFDDMTRPALTGRLEVTIDLCPPDKRKRDIDNYAKAVLDAMTHAGVWGDDSQIDRLIINRLPPEKPGHAFLTIIDNG